MAKIWAIGLVICVAAWAFVPSLGYFCELSEIAREVRFLLKKESGPVVRFAQKKGEKSDFRWNNDHEFWLGGQLFDLQKLEQRGDSTLFFARKDDREQGLHADFATNFEHEKKGQNPSAKRFWKNWLDCPFELPDDDFLLKMSFFLLKKAKNCAEWALSAPDGSPPTPPPDRSS